MEDQQADKAEHQRIFDAKPECDTRERVGEWLGFVAKCGERGHEKTMTDFPAPDVIPVDFLRHTVLPSDEQTEGNYPFRISAVECNLLQHCFARANNQPLGPQDRINIMRFFVRIVKR